MKKYIMITGDTLVKMDKCFAGAEELSDFITQLEGFTEEQLYNFQARKRLNDEDAAIVVLRQVAIVAIFCRKHMDLIHQLVQNLDAKEITKEEMEKYMEGDA